MKIDQATVCHIAKLARIRLTQDEAERLEGELSGILDWVEQLEEVDTEGVEPMTSVVAVTTKMRDDKVTDGGYPEAILENAPAREGNFFVVPKVVE
jgi:aspartyl-tRNA(Asn)/glutamyl-tRNA(Gln) amidotransferase subunit C